MRQPFTKNFSYVLVGKTITNSLQAIFYLAIASILEPEGYGQLIYLISIAGVFTVIFRFGFSTSITVHLAKEDYQVANQLNVLSLLCIGIGAIALLWIDEFVALVSLALSLFILNQSNLLGLKNYKKYFLMAVIRGSFFVTIPFLGYFIFDIPGILLGIAISNFLGGFYYLRHVNFKIKLRRLQINFKTLSHNFAIEASEALPKWADKLLIVPLVGLTITGIYHFNLQILLICAILPQALRSFLLAEEASGVIHKKLVTVVIGSSVILTILVITLSPIIIQQLFPKYAEGVFSLQVLMLSLVPLTFSYIYTAKLQAGESTKIGFSVIIKIGFLLLLIYLFAIPYGLVGLSLSVLLSAIAYTIFLAFLYKKRSYGNAKL